MGASLLIPSLLVKCTLSGLAKSPKQCCKLHITRPESPVRDMTFNPFEFFVDALKKVGPYIRYSRLDFQFNVG